MPPVPRGSITKLPDGPLGLRLPGIVALRLAPVGVAEGIHHGKCSDHLPEVESVQPMENGYDAANVWCSFVTAKRLGNFFKKTGKEISGRVLKFLKPRGAEGGGGGARCLFPEK